MRIVFNLRDQDWQTTKSLGILNVSLRLLRGLAAAPGVERVDILANWSLATRLDQLPSPSRWRLHYADYPAPRGWLRLAWDHWSVSRACDRLQPDWLLLPKGFSPLGRWPRARVSAYVHDHLFGHYRRLQVRPFPRGEAFLFQRMLRQTALKADVIVTNSAFTAAAFSAEFQPRARVIAIGAPVDPHEPAEGASTGPSLLVPTSVWPHKLTRQAIDWLQRWTANTAFPGQVHGYGTLPTDTPWPTQPGWKHHGRISDDALAALETPDSVLIYFSAYEGYGLPPVEAAASGRRAIASDIPPLRETMPPESLFANASYDRFQATLAQTLADPPRAPVKMDHTSQVALRWLDALSGR